MKPSSKYWFDNEKHVLKVLGLKPTKGSGNGVVEKEDGYNDDVLLQLKSTSKDQITIKRLDIDKLLWHASVEHKVPVFAINFVDDGSIWLMVPHTYAGELASLANGESRERPKPAPKRDKEKVVKPPERTMVKSSRKGREAYLAERSKEYGKKERRAK